MVNSVMRYWQSNALQNIIPIRPALGDEVDGPAIIDTLTGWVGDDNLLEVGCGRGRLAKYFESERYLGVDICYEAVTQAQLACPRHRFFWVEPLAALAPADVVLVYTVLHHVPCEIISQMIGTLTDATERVIVAEVMDVRFRHYRVPPTINRSLEEYESLFKAYGFKLNRSVVLPYAAYDDRKMTVAEFVDGL